jgi:hypothetical protein
MSYFRTIPRREPPKPSFELLKPHLEAGHELILLEPLSEEPSFFPHRRPPTVEEVRAHMAKGGNVGVGINFPMLVIDVDTRGAPEGISPIRQLENSLGVNLSRGPLVLNGGCGQHFYFKHPGSLVIEDSSHEFPGVKPKGLKPRGVKLRRPRRGWHVTDSDGSLFLEPFLPEFPALTFWAGGIIGLLASGSVHPITREHCFCEILQDNLADAPLVPRELLVRLVEKPQYSGVYDVW